MKNEIKKLLYKEKPKADLDGKYEEGIYYICKITTGEVYFFIPKDECYYEDKYIFENQMEAKELIRWIIDFYDFETKIKYVNIK